MAAAAPALTFPRPIFAAVSPHPFLQAHLAAGKSSNTALRANNRAAHEFRTPGIHTGSLTHSNGSAVVRLGNTSVVCGVRAEILKEEDIAATHATSGQKRGNKEEGEEEDDAQELEALRLLVPNVELATGSTPAHIPGNAPTAFAQSLITRLRTLLHSTRLLHAADLRILHTPFTNPDDLDVPPEPQLKGYWTLYLDVFFISVDGNAFDAAWLSLLAALRDTLLPHAFWDDEYEGILCSDDPSEAQRLRLRGLPVASSFAVFERSGEEEEDENNWVLSDPDAFEEGVCREGVTVVVDGGELCRIEKRGGGAVGREAMVGLVKRAGEQWRVIEKILKDTA